MSSIYKDPSIGNLINIVIVKLVIINNELVRKQLFPPAITNATNSRVTKTNVIFSCMSLRRVQSFRLTHRPL